MLEPQAIAHRLNVDERFYAIRQLFSFFLSFFLFFFFFFFAREILAFISPHPFLGMQLN